MRRLVLTLLVGIFAVALKGDVKYRFVIDSVSLPPDHHSFASPFVSADGDALAGTSAFTGQTGASIAC